MQRAQGKHDVDLLFRAFSDRTRVRILNLLDDAERCVGDLVRILGLPQPTVSRHLAYLRRAELVEVRRDGAWAYYRLAPARTRFHGRLLGCLEDLRGVPEFVEDVIRARDLEREGASKARA